MSTVKRSSHRSCSDEMHASSRLRLELVGDRAAWLGRLCAWTDGEIAHLGCADSPYTEELLAAGALLHSGLVSRGEVTGIDVDAGAVALLRSALSHHRFVVADVTHELPDTERGRYRLVIAGEVLEHVPDIDAFLRGAGQLLAPGGRVCVTVPNACCPKIGLRSIVGHESVHPDHRVYFGPRTLHRTLVGAGYELESIASCLAPVASPAGRLMLNPLLSAGHRLFQGPVGDGLIALATVRARVNAAVIAS